MAAPGASSAPPAQPKPVDGSITLKVFYSRSVSATATATITVASTALIRDVISQACQQFCIQKPEKYGLEKRGSTNNSFALLRKSSFLRSNEAWLADTKPVSHIPLHNNDELVLRVKNKFSVGPNAVKVLVPSMTYNTVFNYSYTTTVKDVLDSVLASVGSDKTKIDKHDIGRWKVFLPIGSTKSGIWMEENRTVDSYDLYAQKGEEQLPSLADLLRVLIVCRRIEDKDDVQLPKTAFKNHSEKKWLARLDDMENYKAKNHKKLKQAIRKGVPETLRGNIWQKLTGSSEKMFGATGVYLRYLHTPIDHQVSVDIEKDLDRTFPSHPFFQTKGMGWTALKNVLSAYAAKNPEIGYCQGENFVAGVLLLMMDEESAFWVFDTIMTKYDHIQFFKPKTPGLTSAMTQFKKLIDINLPEIGRTLDELGITVHMFSSAWFHTIFSYDCQLPFVLRLWDIYFYEGPSILFRVALAILKESSNKIIGCDMESVMLFLKKATPQIADPDTVLASATKIKNHVLMSHWFTPEELHEFDSGHGRKIRRATSGHAFPGVSPAAIVSPQPKLAVVQQASNSSPLRGVHFATAPPTKLEADSALNRLRTQPQAHSAPVISIPTPATPTAASQGHQTGQQTSPRKYSYSNMALRRTKTIGAIQEEPEHDALPVRSLSPPGGVADRSRSLFPLPQSQPAPKVGLAQPEPFDYLAASFHLKQSLYGADVL